MYKYAAQTVAASSGLIIEANKQTKLCNAIYCRLQYWVIKKVIAGGCVVNGGISWFIASKSIVCARACYQLATVQTCSLLITVTPKMISVSIIA